MIFGEVFVSGFSSALCQVRNSFFISKYSASKVGFPILFLTLLHKVIAFCAINCPLLYYQFPPSRTYTPQHVERDLNITSKTSFNRPS